MARRLFVAKNGEIQVRLDDTMRVLLRQVSEELREVLLVDDESQTRRLYPTAYPDDDELESEYQEVVHDKLLMQRLDGIDQLQASIEADSISIDVADAWMATVNQIRLVLGTQLDVGEGDGAVDEGDPNATSMIIYQVLSHILEELTHARIRSL
ncbi:MAG: hypothetical protein ACI81L_001033 [Verrucomicrobiales bacterium]|jgi:hypothetical protein